uniref:Uncharacterized protein n=1 Tax=Sphaerodactylus townsendi TaxID=933632 RepID=A0ACB8FD06_9SAUR
MEGAGPAKTPLVSCPVCSRQLPAPAINLHLDRCLQGKGGEEQRPEAGGEGSSCPPALQQPCKKKMRLSSSPERNSREEEPGDSRSPPPVFSLFQKGRSSGARTPGRGAAAAAAAASPTRGPEKLLERESPPALGADASVPELSGKDLAQKLEGKPLADKLRPDTLEDYMGQNRVVGEQTLLRSLLEAHEIPSLILWGPPGCGKDLSEYKELDFGNAFVNQS